MNIFCTVRFSPSPSSTALVKSLPLVFLFLATVLRLSAQVTVNYTSNAVFTVPAGVTSIDVVAKGGQGATIGAAAGNGGTVSATLQVTPGDALYIYIGGMGSFGLGGANGGGGAFFGSGGGATDIRIGGTNTSNRVLVAGGGGGGSDDANGGHGGNTTAASGGNYDGSNRGGGGGTPTTGGAGGAGEQNPGGDGTTDGNGGSGSGFHGGGGGGGYTGGGGGGTNPAGGGGGGGGSSYAHPTLCTNVVHTAGNNTGNGSLSITYTPPPCGVSAVSVIYISSCSGNNTTCGTDDTYTANIAVTYANPPGTGTLDLSGADIVGTPPSVAVGSIGATSYTFMGVTLRADGAAIDITAAFSATPTCMFTNSNAGTAPTSCSPIPYVPSNITVTGFSCSSLNNTCVPGGVLNGAPRWRIENNLGSYQIVWTGSRWEIQSGMPPVTVAANTGGSGSITNLPCSDGWTDPLSIGCIGTGIVLSGSCGYLGGTPGPPCAVTDIALANASGCHNNNTTTSSDDYFTAEATVTFAYAPNIGNLTLKRGNTVLATKLASELACVSTWTFANVQIAADGAAVALTAEFSNTCTYTSGPLMTAPTSCSCVPTTAFTTCPTAQSVNVPANSCASTALTYSAVANGTPTPTYMYVFSGATTTSGAQSGTGSGSTFNVGQTTVTLTAANGCGSATCSFVVTVTDNIPPSIVCPNSTTVNVTAGTCSASVTYTQPSGLDNCGILGYDLLAGKTSGSTFDGGTTLVRWMVTDNSNNTATCTFSVTVTDNIPPSITCPQPLSLPTAPNLCGANASWTAPVGTDNCLSVNTSGSHTSGSFFAKGQSTVTYTATDGAGLTSACSFTITVGDSQAPALACPASTTRPNTSGQCGAVVTYAPTVTENCPGTTMTLLSGFASGAAFPIGTTIVTLLVTDGAALTNTCSFTVTVQDTEKPVVLCPNPITRNTDVGQCSAIVAYANPTYTDNCPPGGNSGLDHLGGGLSGSAFAKGVTTVTWMATDAANLTATCTFTVTVTDTQAPDLACPANQNVNTGLGTCTATVVYPTPAASDNCALPSGQTVWVGGGSAPTASGASQTATFAKGTTTVQWRTTDGAGLTRTCTFRVVVSDREKPALTCPPAVQTNTAAGTCTAVVTYSTPSFTDNCAPTTGAAVRLSGPPPGSPSVAGVYAVVFRATDAAGNTNTCSMQVTIVDNEAPVVTCPASTTVTGSGAPCVIQVFYGTVTALDNCSGVLTPFLVSGLGSGSIFPAGTTVNTFRAVAPNGQTGECTFSVTVNCPVAKPGNGNTTNNIQTVTALSLSPNPANATVWANFGTVGASGGLLTVFDALGRAVWQEQLAEGQNQAIIEELRNWPSGLYLVALKTDRQSAVKQLVVE